jgi:outer membrane protein OmpA-like peptidoglycan-associated protein
MRLSSIIIFLSLLVNNLFGQSDELMVQGKILDAATGKGVKSSIRYSSIPTQSLFGRFNDSTFSFSIFGSAKYQITADATGYNPKTVIVDPKEPSSLHRDIILSPKGQTVVLNNLIFSQGKATISPKSYPELDEVAQMMKENNKIVIQLEGHTDNVGNAGANMKLSENRVESVKKYLVAQGISKGRVKTKAFGGTQPLRNEMTPEARAKNRRVEMRILED